jgi:hypothetical protein
LVVASSLGGKFWSSLEQNTATRTNGGEDRTVGSRWCEGYALLGPLGRALGRVQRIFCKRAGEAQYVRIRAGLFGKRLVLIPVVDVAVDHGRRAITLR